MVSQKKIFEYDALQVNANLEEVNIFNKNVQQTRQYAESFISSVYRCIKSFFSGLKKSKQARMFIRIFIIIKKMFFLNLIDEFERVYFLSFIESACSTNKCNMHIFSLKGTGRTVSIS